MSVDTRVHIAGDGVLQEQAVVRRTSVYRSHPSSRYGRRKAIAFVNHQGEDVRVSLEDLGAALRILKVSAADLGYKPRGSDAGRAVDRNRKAARS